MNTDSTESTEGNSVEGAGPGDSPDIGDCEQISQNTVVVVTVTKSHEMTMVPFHQNPPDYQLPEKFGRA